MVCLRYLPNLGNDTSTEETFLLFLTLIPLLNAPLDWLSLGISRGLLGAIASRRHTGLTAFFWALLDFLLALFFLVLVSLVTVAGIALANRMAMEGGGIEMVNLSTLLDGIAGKPADSGYYWVYLMVLTTLIPTLIHLLIASVALILHLGHYAPISRWRNTLAAKLSTQDRDSRVKASIYLTAVITIGAALPIIMMHAGWRGASELHKQNAIGWLTTQLKGVAGWVNPGAVTPVEQTPTVPETPQNMKSIMI